MVKTFYICSYGGCGSKLLTDALSKYGEVAHIHSRKPPDLLEYVGNHSANNFNWHPEWFNGVKIPNNEINNYLKLNV